MLMREEFNKDNYNIIKYDNTEHNKEDTNKVDKDTARVEKICWTKYQRKLKEGLYFYY